MQSAICNLQSAISIESVVLYFKKHHMRKDAMKNTALVTIFLLLLTGCLDPNTLDSTSQETIKSSAQSITADMTEQEQDEFAKALMYYSLGGQNAWTSMVGSFDSKNDGASPETLISINLQSLDGLTGQEVIEKYREALAKDKELRERKEKPSKLKRAKSKKPSANYLRLPRHFCVIQRSADRHLKLSSI